MNVSVELKKLTDNLSLCTHMLINLFPVWAGIKLNKKIKTLKKNFKNSKEEKKYKRKIIKKNGELKNQ